jgi:dihydroxy-acid dehydratase
MRAAEATGRAIVDLVNGGVTARRIITKASLENTARVMVATGGSTNTFIHLSAIANEIGIGAETMMDIYDGASVAIPSVARVNPSSEYDMEDFYRAGGIPQVMKELGEDLDLSCLTVSGETLGENLEKWSHPFEVDRRVIRSKGDPFSRTGGLAVLRGNLAPGTGITKPIAIDPSMHYFSGPARVFECEEDANEAILTEKIS